MKAYKKIKVLISQSITYLVPNELANSGGLILGADVALAGEASGQVRIRNEARSIRKLHAVWEMVYSGRSKKPVEVHEKHTNKSKESRVEGLWVELLSIYVVKCHICCFQ